MSKRQFRDYVRQNFTVSGEFLRLLDNVLDYISIQGYICNEDALDDLQFFLEGTIGIEREEYKDLILTER